MATFDSKLIGKATGAALMALALGASAAGAAMERAPESDGVSPLGGYLAARHAQQQRDYGAAARFLGRTLAADPGNLDLVRRTFLFRVGDGDIAQALPLANRISDLDRHAGFADLVLVLQQVKEGNFAEAQKRAEALPADGLVRLAAPMIAAWAMVAQGQTDAAIQLLAVPRAGNPVPELTTLHRALIADKADRIDDAAGAYDKLNRDASRLTWRTVELAGNFYERHQRVAAARSLYQRLQNDSDSGAVVDAAMKRLADGTIPPRQIATPQDGIAEALFDLASMLNQRDTLDAGLIYARLAMYLRPDFPIDRLLLAEIAEELNHFDEALALYRGIDPASPLGWSARLRQAAMLDQLGRTDDAVSLLRTMASERPRDRQAITVLGDLLRTHERFKEAVVAYDDAFARFEPALPRDWRLYYSRGIALERSQQWSRAEIDLRRALELEPEQPMVLNYLGYSWIDQGSHLDQALRMVERAVALRPNDGYIVDSLGWAYFRLGHYGKATENLERAIELVPEDATINDHLGDAYWRSGRRIEARFQWNRALQFKPEADEKTKIEVKLDRGLGAPVALPPAKGG